jgi:rSAM/selenodomain-associated transferase 1
MKRLLVFLKHPTPGQVKTRLAASIGAQGATDIYRHCAELILGRLTPYRQQTTLCVDPPTAMDAVRTWVGPDWVLAPQQGGDLGERLMCATTEAFQRGARHVVVVGTDAPWMTSEDIDAAFHALDEADVVLGPTEDGGYYLIGLGRPLSTLFDGMAWSTPSVYEQTIAKAAQLGLRVRSLRIGYDLDRLEDLERFLVDESTQNGDVSIFRRLIPWGKK